MMKLVWASTNELVSILDYDDEGCREDDLWLRRDEAGDQRRQHDVA